MHLHVSNKKKPTTFLELHVDLSSGVSQVHLDKPVSRLTIESHAQAAKSKVANIYSGVQSGKGTPRKRAFLEQ